MKTPESPPGPESEKPTGEGGPLRTRMKEITDPIGDVNSEIDRLLRQWLRTGEDFPRRLAHALRDAARKGAA